jgi:hypothetical protein
MAGSYRQKQENNRSRFYILLSIVFIVVMFKWGIPAIMNVIAGPGGVKVSTDKDIIPPQAPDLSALPEATNSGSVSVEGYTEKGAALSLLVNDLMTANQIASDDGSFKFSATLVPGTNRIQVKAADSAGNESQSEIKLVTYDNKPLEMTVSSPKDGSQYMGKNNQTVDIQGSVNKSDSQVLINNSFVMLGKDGTFVYRIQLNAGDNPIKIIASDQSGNTLEKDLKLVYTP